MQEEAFRAADSDSLERKGSHPCVARRVAMHDMSYTVDLAEPVEAIDPCKEPFIVWSMPMSLDRIVCK